MEPSAAMLRQAAAHPEDLDLRQGTAEEFDVPAGSIDLIMSMDVIHYVRRPRLFFDRAFAGFGELSERVVESDYELTDASRFRDKSYSCLHLISDEEFAAGISALEADLARGPVRANLRSLALWGRRPV